MHVSGGEQEGQFVSGPAVEHFTPQVRFQVTGSRYISGSNRVSRGEVVQVVGGEEGGSHDP